MSTNVARHGPPGRYRNQTTQRVLELLKMFISGVETRGVTELSDETGMTKSMVHRALSTLEKGGICDARSER
jgi:DNA-binding IclR family transcriptional regulator